MFEGYGFLSRVKDSVEVDIHDFQNRLLLCATILDNFENKQRLFPYTASTEWLLLRYF
jgi:hypothetical protein